jgi:hypothetical protein
VVAQLLGVSILLFTALAPAPQRVQPLLHTTTDKSLDAFADCFTKAADLRAQAWAFMPKGRGGTFTNSGAGGWAPTYWLQVNTADRGGEIRLFGGEGAQPSASLIEAVKRCR